MALFPTSSGVQDIVVQTFTKEIAINANSSATFKFTGISKAGYTPLIAIYCKNSQTTGGVYPVYTSALVDSSGEAEMAIRNTTNNNYSSIVLTCYVIFVKK